MVDTIDFRRSLPPDVPGFARQLASSLGQMAQDPRHLGALMHESRAESGERERAAGARFLGSRLGADVSADRILITNGTQSALALLFRDIVGSSGLLLAEALTYGSLRALAGKCAIRVEGVAIDEEGIGPEAFERACRTSRPRALYCNPSMHNPTTATMSLRRRWAVIEIARKYGVTIIEDEALGRLYPDMPQPLATLAPEICWYVMTTTKCLSHGLRLSYTVAPSAGSARSMLASAGALSFWVPMPLCLALATGWVEDGTADTITEEIVAECRLRQRHAAELLNGFNVRAPEGAMHIWLSLPAGTSASEFVRAAEDRGVMLRPASHYSVDGSAAPEAVRASLSSPQNAEAVERGLILLREMLEAR